MTVFVQNKSGIVHETTEAIARDLVGRGEVVYVSEPEKAKEEPTPKKEKAKEEPTK